MNRKAGAPPPPSGQCLYRTSSSRPPSTTAFDAETGNHGHEGSWNHRQLDAELDLSGHQAKRLSHTCAAPPKLLLRPLVPISDGMEPQYVFQNSDGLNRTQRVFAGEAPRAFGRSRHYAGLVPEVAQEWGSGQAFNCNAVDSGNAVHAAGGPVTNGAPVMVLPHPVYDVLPYEVAELAPPLASMPHHSAEPVAAFLGSNGQQASVPRRLRYRQRVLLQRLVPSPDNDGSYIQEVPFVDTYALERLEDGITLPNERPTQNPPNIRQLYGMVQKEAIVQQCAPYGTARNSPVLRTSIDVAVRGPATTRGASLEFAAAERPVGWPGDRVVLDDPALRAALEAGRTCAVAGEFAGDCQAVRLGQLYGWTAGNLVPIEAEGEVDADANAEARSETRGALATSGTAAAVVERAKASTAAAAVAAIGAAAAFGNQDPSSARGLWNLEALADAACRAAELLEGEGTVEGRAEALADTEAAEAGSVSLGSSQSRRNQEVEVGSRERGGLSGGGGRRRAVITTGAAGTSGRKQQHQLQQQPQQQPQQQAQQQATVISPAGADTAPVAMPGAPAGLVPPAPASLPLTVFHQDRKCPKVLAPRSGRLGDTKHLVLPAEIAAALPREICFGVSPVRVRALFPSAATQTGGAAGRDPSDPNVRQQQQQLLVMETYEIECQIGNGPGGFPALHIPVSQALYGRPVRRFTLLPDMTLEVELGQSVVKPSRGGRRAAGEAGDAADADTDADAEGDTVGDAADAAYSSPEGCASPTGERNSALEVAIGRELVKMEIDGGAAAGAAGVPTAVLSSPAGVASREAPNGGPTGTGVGKASGSNVSDDTRVVGSGGAFPAAAAVTATTTEPPPAAAVAVAAAQQAQAAAGGGSRKRLPATLSLPIVVRRPAGGKPTVMRSCTGAVGSKKHLPLPANIIKALPHPQRSGAAPVEVVIRYSTSTAAAAAAGAAASTDDGPATPREEERLQCLVGPTGSHGCTALQVPVTRRMNGRRLLYITLRTDLAMELGLGDVVEMSGGGGRGGKGAAARADTAEDNATETTDGTAVAAMAGTAAAARLPADVAGAAAATMSRPLAEKWKQSWDGDAEGEEGEDAAAPPPSCKRRRSASIPACDSAAVAVATAAPRHTSGGAEQQPLSVATTAPVMKLQEGPEVAPGFGTAPARHGGDGPEDDAAQRRAFEEFLLLAVRAGIPVERLLALQAPPVPPPPQSQPQPYQATQEPLQPLQREPALQAPRRPYYSVPMPPPYGTIQYVQTAAGLRPAVYGGGPAPPPPLMIRRVVPAAPNLHARPAMDMYGRQLRHAYYAAEPPGQTEEMDLATSGGVGVTPDGGADRVTAAAAPTAETPASVAAAAALGRAWGLLQQVPRAQLAAARALAAATNNSGGSSSPDASAALSSFRSCLTGILGLLMRAREAAVSDLAVRTEEEHGGSDAAESLRSDLLAAAPAMLNAAECLLEWYGLLAAATDERTAVSYATELASSAALVKAQLAHELAPLAVVVRT